MSTKFKLLCTFLFLALGQLFYAQVTGTVVDSDDIPVADAEVTVQGKDVSTLTDLDGNFEIDANVGDQLVVYNPDGSSKTYNVSSTSLGTLKLTNELETLIVTGYQSLSEPKSTIAQTTIRAEDIENKPNASVLQTLQGQVPGLNVMTSTGQPGSGSEVIIRGIGSINGKTSPLYVVDGVQLGADEFSKFYNQNDIASATVLKDAGATALYGNKGSNGVIVITTKSGKLNSDLKTEVNTMYGLSYIQPNNYNIMNARELLKFQQAFGSGRGATMTDAEIAAYDIDTDWEDYFLRQDVIQNYDINFSGGSDNMKSFTSLGYFRQGGIVRSGSDLNRFTVRNNLTGFSKSRKFQYSTVANVGYSRRNITGSVGTGGVNQNALLASQKGSPIVSPDQYQGSQQLLELYQSDGTLLYTPLFIIDKLKTFKNIRHELKTNLVASFSYNLTDDLTANARLAGDYTNLELDAAENPVSFNSLLFANEPDDVGSQEEQYIRDYIMTNNFNLQYRKVFNTLHTLDLGAYMEYSYYNRKFFSYDQTTGINPFFYDFGSDAGYIPDNDQNDLYVPQVGSGYARISMLSYFGTLEYDYDSKYGLAATYRRDATSRFRGNNKWGTFWSISGRWNIDQESFMESSKFNILKLRASYGTTGNQFVNGSSEFGSLGLFQSSIFDPGGGYQNTPAFGYSVRNSDLTWETTSQFNIGLDLDYNKRFRMTFDWYDKKTEDLFNTLPVSYAVAPSGSIIGNFGSMKNSGVELMLSYDLIDREDMVLTLKGNGSYNKNEITEVLNEDGFDISGNTYQRVGDILNSYYLVEYAGVNPANGELLFYNDQGQVTEELNPDRDGIFTNKSRIPVYQGSFGADFDYKGFYANVQFNYAADLHRIDYDLAGYFDPSDAAQFNISRDLGNYWTVDNKYTEIPGLFASQIGNSAEQSDRFLIDASYVRLRNIRVGYYLDGVKWFRTSFVKGVNIYLQAENIKTWSKWRGWDAEVNKAAVQYDYPAPRSLQLGLQVKF